MLVLVCFSKLVLHTLGVCHLRAFRTVHLTCFFADFIFFSVCGLMGMVVVVVVVVVFIVVFSPLKKH